MVDYNRALSAITRCIIGYRNKAKNALSGAERKKYEEYVEDFEIISGIVKEAADPKPEPKTPKSIKADVDFSALSNEAQVMLTYMYATCRIPKPDYHFQDPERRYIIMGCGMKTLRDRSIVWEVSILPEDSEEINGCMTVNLNRIELVSD